MRLTSRLAIPAASAVLILALSACGSSDDSHSTMSGAGTTSSSMAEGMTTTATSGDVEFAQMMIPHHEQAVEMADLALQNDSASPRRTPRSRPCRDGSASGGLRRAQVRWRMVRAG